MTKAPYNAIGRIQMTFVTKGVNAQEFSGSGTGTLIDTHLVITAAHNVYHRESKS
jgi:V8-like Glu-specific endopeptidase